MDKMERGLCFIGAMVVMFCLFMFYYCSTHYDQTVESYCSIAYEHNVKDYKVCKNLSQTELIEKLTKDFGNKSEVPDLEIIK